MQETVNIVKRCRNIIMFLVVMFSGGWLAAQPKLTIGNVAVCNDTSVLLPVTGTSLNNVGAITLFIRFDPAAMSFHSIQGADPQLNGMVVNSLTNPSRVAVVWSKVSGASFPNTLLFNLKFTLLKQSGSLSFINDSCEIADLTLPPQILSVQFTGGSVFESIPAVTSGPENQTIPSQTTTSFQVSGMNTSGFTWQESRNSGVSWTDLTETSRYSGTGTNTLTIRNVPVSYDKNVYRCMLHANRCHVPSNAATLSVDSITGTDKETTSFHFGLINNPNPFTSKTTLEYSVPETGTVNITLLSMTGQVVSMPVGARRAAGVYRLENSFADLPAGIYFCHYLFKGPAGFRETYRKMIKFN